MIWLDKSALDLYFPGEKSVWLFRLIHQLGTKVIVEEKMRCTSAPDIATPFLPKY